MGPASTAKQSTRGASTSRKAFAPRVLSLLGLVLRWCVLTIAGCVAYTLLRAAATSVGLGAPLYEWQWYLPLAALIAGFPALFAWRPRLARVRGGYWPAAIAALVWLITGYDGFGAREQLPVAGAPRVPLSFWAYGDPAAQPQAGLIFGAFQDRAVNDSRVASSHCPYSNGNVYFDTGGTAPASGYDRISKAAAPVEYEGSWQHWTLTKNADTGEQSIYLSGALWHSAGGMTRTMRGVTAFTIGCRPDHADYYYIGMIDDFRLYNRALTQEEIAWLAGRTSFDKGF